MCERLRRLSDTTHDKPSLGAGGRLTRIMLRLRQRNCRAKMHDFRLIRSIDEIGGYRNDSRPDSVVRSLSWMQDHVSVGDNDEKMEQ